VYIGGEGMESECNSQSVISAEYMVFWVFAPRNVTDGYKRFGGQFLPSSSPQIYDLLSFVTLHGTKLEHIDIEDTNARNRSFAPPQNCVMTDKSK
jgi:hypothetical protein